MRILFLSNLYPPNVVGGYERLCHEVATEMASRGHEVTILTSSHGEKVAKYPGQRVLRRLELLTGREIYVPFPGTPEQRQAVNAHNLAILHETLNEVRPDVVFAWNLFFLDASILVELEASPYRTVVMLTDNWLLVMRNPQFVANFFQEKVHGSSRFIPPPPPPTWRVLAGRAKRTLQQLAGITPPRRIQAIFGSNFVRDFYAAGGIWFRSHRIIHNGVRQPLRTGVPAPDRTKTTRLGELRLLFAGRLVDLKGADTAVVALPLLNPAELGFKKITLTIVGDGQDLTYLDRFRAMLAASPRAADITLERVVPEAELPSLFDRHDIYLFPSLYEPFSLTLIHALACGIPTIASDIGGNLEIIEDGQSGLLFQKGNPTSLAEAVTRLARDPMLRQRLALGGQRTSLRFTFERMTEEMEQFLRTTT
ncbi:glycosyltransferase family 4 protein [Roseomonas xinghualingensis]|uniref:glycosyltransferase family 4 protein n=1 Tax=Roseomonas xinghualingensis TaxID=2986475 RepID=UPI0021F1A00C|nr:glycosyltransferase family 4 protein [Roseomonas sp. SXEYE001]MCV4209819.1 glycosyltransferase family 4 protein [Roseomonas sp. SXEYE001]